MKCKFNVSYREVYESPEKYIPFDCNFQALGSGYCLFHDESYHKVAENHEKIQKTLDSIFDQSLQNDIDIALIGYNLPAIVIKKNFKNRIFFDKTKFFGPTVIQSTFVKDASFKECDFLDYANFSPSIFHSFVDFSKTSFSKNANFAAVQLHHPYFKETKFYNHANFENAIFERHVSFQQSSLRDVYFSGANFKEGATLGGCSIYQGVFAATFGGEVYIYGSSFNSMEGMSVTFGNAKFSGRTKFVNCSFNTIAYFNDISFDDIMEIKECHFVFPANFNNTKFSDVSFRQSEFDGPTYFIKSKFNKEADFSRVHFKDFVDFSESEFIGYTDFSEAELNRASFVNNKFGKTSFFRTKFFEVIFKNMLFMDETRFHFAFFEDQEHTIFNGSNLENVSFLNTDILRIKFDNVEWGKDNRYKILEERILEEKLKTNQDYNFDFDLHDVLSMYRNLRENYEYRLKYDEAGEFFVREMEVKRNYKET